MQQEVFWNGIDRGVLIDYHYDSVRLDTKHSPFGLVVKHMTLQQVKYFIEVAHTQNFTQASQNLNVSQPSLSHSIRVLEQELEVPLFVRSSGKKVVLTTYGEAFLPYCKETVATLQQGEHLVQQMRNPMNGVVNIAYSYINGSQIPAIFQSFYKKSNNNDISVEFKVNHRCAVFERDVLFGKVDLAFACTKAFEGLDVMPIAKQELVLMVPTNHRLAKKKKVSLQDIKDEIILWYYKDSNLYKWIVNMFQTEGIDPDIRTNISDWSSQISYVALGQGVSIAPRLPVDSQLISVLEIDHPLNHRNIYMMWAKDKKLSNAVEYVKQFCIDYSESHYGRITDD